MTDQNESVNPSQNPNPPKTKEDYDRLEEEYAKGDYARDFMNRILWFRNFPDATSEEREAARRKWIDEWPRNVQIQKERDARRNSQEDLGITPGSA